MLHLDRIHRLRQLMRRLSLVVGLVTGVSIPLGYAAASWVHHQDRLTTLASLSADRLAEYAYVHGPTWRFSQERLSDIIRLGPRYDNEIREVVHDTAGNPIVSHGSLVPGPIMRRSMAITNGNETVGRVVAETSLLPMLMNTWLIALFGAAVGSAAYATMHRLPLRALDRTLERLQEALLNVEAHAEETSRAYDELQRQHRLVEETTHELMQARDAARAADRTKSAFLATMSHELRTPLNAIIGFSDMLKSEVSGPLGNDRYREYAGDILDSGRHLLAVINDVLDMSKIEAGQLMLHLESVDLPCTLDACLRLVRGRSVAGGVDLDVLVADCLPPVRADSVKLKQIVLNLLSNAVKFTPKGGLIRVSAAFESPGFVTIRVIDSGIGMSEDDVQRALEPFQQIDNPFTRRQHGTGLGLPLTKALVEHHGGSLSIESEPGVGTAISVTLPASRPVVKVELDNGTT